MSVEKFKPAFTSGKIKHEAKPYTQVLNKVLQECTNLEAIGLWCHFQSKPENWDINVQYVQNMFGIGRDKAYKLFNFLIESNLMEYHQEKNEDGTFGQRYYVIKNGEDFLNKKAELSTEKAPLPDLPYTALPHTENPTTTNKRFITNERTKTNGFFDQNKNNPVNNFKKPNEIRSTVKFWERGNPDFDRVNSPTHTAVGHHNDEIAQPELNLVAKRG